MPLHFYHPGKLTYWYWVHCCVNARLGPNASAGLNLSYFRKRDGGSEANSSITHSGNISTYCSNLFSHMASSSLALGAIVTHAAQQKLSPPLTSIPDLAARSIPVWSANNPPRFAHWENTCVNCVCNICNIVRDHLPEQNRGGENWGFWMQSVKL